jgi:hypothetical protein
MKYCFVFTTNLANYEGKTSKGVDYFYFFEKKFAKKKNISTFVIE